MHLIILSFFSALFFFPPFNVFLDLSLSFLGVAKTHGVKANDKRNEKLLSHISLRTVLILYVNPEWLTDKSDYEQWH